MSTFNPNIGVIIEPVLKPFISTLNDIPNHIMSASNFTDTEKNRMFEIINTLKDFEVYLFNTYGDLIVDVFEVDPNEVNNPTKQTALYLFTSACDNSSYVYKQDVVDAISDLYDIIRK